jgi:hypothetical protein
MVWYGRLLPPFSSSLVTILSSRTKNGGFVGCWTDGSLLTKLIVVRFVTWMRKGYVTVGCELGVVAGVASRNTYSSLSGWKQRQGRQRSLSSQKAATAKPRCVLESLPSSLPNSDGNSSSSSSKSNSHAIGLRRSICSEPSHPSLGMIRPPVELSSLLVSSNSAVRLRTSRASPWRACPSSINTVYKGMYH